MNDQWGRCRDCGKLRAACTCEDCCPECKRFPCICDKETDTEYHFEPEYGEPDA